MYGFDDVIFGSVSDMVLIPVEEIKMKIDAKNIT
jgi:hypothetical protein